MRRPLTQLAAANPDNPLGDTFAALTHVLTYPAVWVAAIAVTLLAVFLINKRSHDMRPRAIMARSWPAIRLTLTLTAAAATAWLLASSLGSASPIFAAVAAVAVGSTKVGGSAKASAQMVAATVTGLLVAEAALSWLGAGLPATLLTLAGALLAGHLIGLGTEGGVAAAITGVFASTLGPQLTGTLEVDRVLATLLGALIGVGASWLTSRRTALRDAESRLDQSADQVADLLSSIASHTAAGLSLEDAQLLLVQSRSTLEFTRQAQPLIQDAVLAARVSSRSSAAAAENLSARYLAIEHTAESANTIMRSMFDALREGTEVPPALGEVMEAVAEAWSDGDLEDTHAPQSAVHADSMTADARSKVKELKDTTEIILSASILSDMERILQLPMGEAAALDVNDPRMASPRPVWESPAWISGLRGDTEQEERAEPEEE